MRALVLVVLSAVFGQLVYGLSINNGEFYQAGLAAYDNANNGQLLNSNVNFTTSNATQSAGFLYSSTELVLEENTFVANSSVYVFSVTFYTGGVDLFPQPIQLSNSVARNLHFELGTHLSGSEGINVNNEAGKDFYIDQVVLEAFKSGNKLNLPYTTSFRKTPDVGAVAFINNAAGLNITRITLSIILREYSLNETEPADNSVFAICNALTSCGSCTANPYCSWCRLNGTGTCLPAVPYYVTNMCLLEDGEWLRTCPTHQNIPGDNEPHPGNTTAPVIGIKDEEEESSSDALSGTTIAIIIVSVTGCCVLTSIVLGSVLMCRIRRILQQRNDVSDVEADVPYHPNFARTFSAASTLTQFSSATRSQFKNIHQVDSGSSKITSVTVDSEVFESKSEDSSSEEESSVEETNSKSGKEEVDPQTNTSQ